MKRFLKGWVIGCWVCGAVSAWAFPSWMGFYGSDVTHNISPRGNPVPLVRDISYSKAVRGLLLLCDSFPFGLTKNLFANPKAPTISCVFTSGLVARNSR